MWRKIVTAVAPTIGAALGGPTGGIAAKFLAKQLLGKEDATEDELSLAVENATPEQLLALKNSDQDFQIELKRLGLEKLALQVEDRKSARTMPHARKAQIVLSAIYTIGYFVVIIGLLASVLMIPEGKDALFNTLIGGLTAAQLAILNFWFGSSSGSQDKDQQRILA